MIHCGFKKTKERVTMLLPRKGTFAVRSQDKCRATLGQKGEAAIPAGAQTSIIQVFLLIILSADQ